MRKAIPEKSYTDGAAAGGPFQSIPIGRVCSPHRERFGTPHQAVLPADPARRPSERACIELFSDRVPALTLRDLAGFDYLWIIAWLHLNHGFRPLVSPPRDPGHRRGLFATRSPHRPNPLGLSAARIVAVEAHRVWVERLDLLDGTPVLDLKPYVPYADSFPNAAAGWLDGLDPLARSDRG